MTPKSRRKKRSKPVAYQKGIVSYEEDLPLPYVIYPGHYGAFVGFSTKENSEIFFCTCCKQSIENWIRITLEENSPQHRFSYGISDLPKQVQDLIVNRNLPLSEIPKLVTFKDKICHKCLVVMPEYSYCHEMYGGKFKQAYGWYISAKAYEWGMNPTLGTVLLEEYTPDEVLEFYLAEFKPAMDNLSGHDSQTRQRMDAQQEMFKKSRRLLNYVENDVRIETGYRLIGEGWIAETQLYYLVKKIFPKYTVIHHYRGKELEGLELDVFVKEINLGLEYQGQQHFVGIKHWGGEESLKKTRERDKKKERLCKAKGICLEKFYFNEDVTPKYLKQKLAQYLHYEN